MLFWTIGNQGYVAGSVYSSVSLMYFAIGVLWQLNLCCVNIMVIGWTHVMALFTYGGAL